MGCNSKKNKAAPEQEPTTLPGKKKCFAYKLGTVARLFGRCKSFPFYMIQPSKEVVENEKFYHHCLLITSNTCNLDPARVKTELNKFWKLTDDWDIRRDVRQNFIASFNSEDDLLRCLKPPDVETFLDEKEVNFSVAMWDEGDREKLDLIKEWLLVYGVPGAYINWKELYQVASAVGVLLEVDEEILESGDKEPIRLRIALGSPVGAPFSYHFVFGWSSRLVKFMIEDKVGRIEGQWKEVEERNVSVPPGTMNKGIDLEGTRVDFTCNSSLDFRSCSSKECKEQLKTTEQNDSVMKEYADIREEGLEVPPETVNKGMDLEGTGVDFAGNCSLDVGSFSGKEHKEELKTTETATLLEVAKFIAELRVNEDIKGNSTSAMAATTANSKIVATGGQSPSESSAGADHMSGLEDCSDKEHQKKLKTCDMATLLQLSKFIEELRADGVIEENNASVVVGTRTNSERATKDVPKATEDMATLLQVSKFTEELRTDGEIEENNASAIEENNASAVVGTRTNSERATKDIPKATEDMVTLLQVSKFIEELRTDGEIEENNASAIVGTRTNSERATEDIPKAEGGQSICGSSTSTSLIEEVFGGMDKPPIKNVYTRRDRKQKESSEGSTLFAHISSDSAHEGIQKPPIKNVYEGSNPKQKGSTGGGGGGGVASLKLNKAMNPGSNSHATRIATSTCNMLDSKSLSEKEHKKEMRMAETTLLGKGPREQQLTQFYEEFNTYNEIYVSFVEMGLRENVLKGIHAYGPEKPFAVHQRGIVPLCKGLDVIHQSLSGTTVTLACGVLQRLNYGSTEFQTLVLVPTRDLAQETQKVIGALGQTNKFCSAALRLCPDNIRMFVLDEADEIITGGLKNQIYNIIQLVPAKIQFAVFSTVMSHEALELCRKCMNKPMKVIVPKDEELEGFSIKQFYVKAEEEESKFENYAIFLTPWQSCKTSSLSTYIRGRGYTVSASHGGMDQHARDVAVQDLRPGTSLVLVTTDLRGADTLQVPVVINYDLPTHPPEGNGVAISFIARADERVLSDIQRFCNAQMVELPSNVTDLL
ncbi:hypothetical protein VPH35_123598 [Triticum aestivum]